MTGKNLAYKLFVLLSPLTLIAISSPALGQTSIRSHEWFLHATGAVDGHFYSNGSGIVVGLVDTGVDSSHSDLTRNVLAGADFTDPHYPDGYGDGRVDLDGHGTSMAGLISAHGHGAHNESGIIGIAPGAKILPARNAIGFGAGTLEQLIAGIRWLTQHNARVISISQVVQDNSTELREAIAEALAKDIVVVAAVGNRPDASTVQYPAAYPGVLAVGATDEHGNHAAISVTGPEVVLSAPGTNIYSDGLNHAYSVGTGTSPATAIVAGAVALVRSRFPKLSAVEVIHRLTATATDKGTPGRDDVYGYGELNIVAALTANIPPLNSAAPPTPTPEASTPQPTSPTPIAIAPKPDSRWLPITGTILVVFALLAVWTIVKRRRT